MIRLRRGAWRVNQLEGSSVAHIIDDKGIDHPIVGVILRPDMSEREVANIIYLAMRPKEPK
jgi:hypothetical protein